MWLLLQVIIMIGVGWTGIYYEWTPNPYALGFVMILAAWLATKLLSSVLDLGKRQNPTSN